MSHSGRNALTVLLLCLLMLRTSFGPVVSANAESAVVCPRGASTGGPPPKTVLERDTIVPALQQNNTVPVITQTQNEADADTESNSEKNRASWK